MTTFSIYLGKPFGIPTRIHWTFWILILWIIYTNASQGQSGVEILWYIAFIFSIFTCVVLHELGHALAARRYSIKTRSITILPIGGVASLEKMPEKPSQELVVAIAGPMVNVVIALTLWVILTFLGGLNIGAEELETMNTINGENFFFVLMAVNITLVLFNMIPAFPMDGGRVLRALLAMQMHRVQATTWAVRIGRFFAIIFVFLGFSFNPFLIVIALFILLSAEGELQMVRTESDLGDHRIRDVIMKNFTLLDQSQPLSTAVRALLDGQETQFLIADGERIIGHLTKKDIIRGLTQFDESVPIHQVTHQGVQWAEEEDFINSIRQRMLAKGMTIMPVGRQGQLTGIVDLENINEFLLIKGVRRT